MVAIYGFLFCFVFLCEWPLSWSFLSSHYTNSCFPCYLFLFNFHMISVSHHNFSLTLSNINLHQFRSCGHILFLCYISTIFDSNYENWPDFNHISIYLNLFLNASFYHVTCLVSFLCNAPLPPPFPSRCTSSFCRPFPLLESTWVWGWGHPAAGAGHHCHGNPVGPPHLRRGSGQTGLALPASSRFASSTQTPAPCYHARWCKGIHSPDFGRSAHLKFYLFCL